MQLLPIDLVRGEVELPSLSLVFQQFMAKLDDPKAKAEDFSDIISTDPSLMVRVLKIVNSAYYSFSSSITDIPHAITIIGLNELRDLILAISVVEFFEGLPNDLVNMRSFWSHSVMTGLLSKSLQGIPELKGKPSLYTAGMLHDVGSLVFYNRLPEIARSVMELQKRENKARYLLEQELMGFDHAAIGGELLTHWGLPELLIEVVAYHHNPMKSPHYQAETQLIQFSDQLARILETQEDLSNISQQLTVKIPFGMSQLHLENAINEAKEKQGEILTIIGG